MIALAEPPDPHKNPASPMMLRDRSLPDNPINIEWGKLPRVESQMAVVFEGKKGVSGFNLHPYLVMYQDLYWAMWSSSPVDEDQAGQQVMYATSQDGLKWSEAKPLTPATPSGMRFIARGWWVRDTKLVALVSMDEAGEYFGPSLQLRAYEWNQPLRQFRYLQVVQQGAINNFPPQQTPDGQWMMSRRDQNRRVYMMKGGVKAIDQWTSTLIEPTPDEARLEEPCWWTLPDGNLTCVLRDNSRSRRLYRSFSTSGGARWTVPVKTDYPDATSKFFCTRLFDGTYMMVSNPNPVGRNPLCVSVSKDGMVFDNLAVLIDERTKPRFEGRAKVAGYQYPHALNFLRDVMIIFSRNKEDIVVLKLPVAAIQTLSERK